MAAGFRPLWGIEFDPDNPDFSRQIADTYEHNFGGHIIRKTVQEVAQGGFQHLERPTVLHISQPCKSFSAANSKTESETDLSAARATCQAIQELQPQAVTVENVTSYRDSQSWQLIRETLTELGYSIKEAVVNAADYGVPQKRQRFLAWAVLQEPPPPSFPLGLFHSTKSQSLNHLWLSHLCPCVIDKKPKPRKRLRAIVWRIDKLLTA